MRINIQVARLCLLFGAPLLLAACGGDDGTDSASANLDPAPPSGTVAPPSTVGGTEETPPQDSSGEQPAPPSTTPVVQNPPIVKNSAPSIKGTPQLTVLHDTTYNFVPEAADDDGDTLHFTVANPPPWASFEPTTGRLYGTPSPADVGTYADIRITVTDGADKTSLQAFAITVTSVANGSAELSWTAPTENTDGSALTDLAGYKIYWGMQPDDLSNSITISNPGVVTYVLDNLVPGTYYFVATAYNAGGAESDPSGMTSITIS